METSAETYSFSLPAGKYWSLELPVSDPEGFYMFEVNVEQKRQVLDDVCVEIMNQDNFKTREFRIQAIAAGARSVGLSSYVTFTSGKLTWGTVSFKPPSCGHYHIVVDNSHSTMTSKKIDLKVYWISSEWSARRAVRAATSDAGWNEAWRLFEQAEADLQNGKLSNSCDSLRKALIVLWLKTCEVLTRKPVLLDEGKTPDIGELKDKLSPYTPDYVLSQMSHTWSMASELAHIEKRGGKEPPLNEVIYAMRLAFSSAAFLVSLVPSSKQ